MNKTFRKILLAVKDFAVHVLAVSVLMLLGLFGLLILKFVESNVIGVGDVSLIWLIPLSIGLGVCASSLVVGVRYYSNHFRHIDDLKTHLRQAFEELKDGDFKYDMLKVERDEYEKENQDLTHKLHEFKKKNKKSKPSTKKK